MGQKNKKVQTTPPLSEYLAQRAQQVRDSAANVYALKDMPEVPIIPEQNVFSKGLAWLGLSDGTTEDSQKMQIGLKATNGWKPYTLDDILANATRIEQQKQAMEDRLNNVFILSNDATSVANGRPQNRHLERRAVEGAKQHAAWEKEHPTATQWSNVLGVVPFAVAAYPLAATTGSGIAALGDAAAATSVGQGITNFLAPIATASIAGATAPQLLDLGLTSGFGAHGLQTAIGEGRISPMTALEIAPLGRLTKPLYEGVVQPGMRLFNSPLTGNWTKIGNREYRLSPNSLGANGSPIESRGIASQITAENAATAQRQMGDAVISGTTESTVKAAENGRNILLDWIRSPFYRARLKEEPLYRVADDVVADAEQMLENAPIRLKDRMQLSKDGAVNGITTTRPAVEEKTLPDGTKVINLNTGLDVDIAADLGENADKTTLHELLHYMTANSKGSPIPSNAGERIINKGWMEPTETHFDAINIIHKNRSKGWQNYILDQNKALLPKYDGAVKMVMEKPEEAKAALIKAGRTPADADAAVQSLRNRYSEWYDIQEQRAYLQELFLSKIKPNLKNPNDAAEIEAFMSEHPEILDGSPAYKYIQEVRPGTLKQYAGYFASALSTLPFINKMTKE